LSKVAFLDRDGVINIDKDYVCKIEDFEFKDGIFELLLHLQSEGYKLIVVTNQSGIGRGYYSEEEFLTLSHWMKDKLKEKGIKIDKIYHCPHAPEERCTCRKPESGMFERAIEEFGIDPKTSLMIGDKESDLDAAKNVGVDLNILVLGKNGQDSDKIEANFKSGNLKSITEFLKGRQ
jgi:D-glycero-D-manno-heptose 1,7-bisphosphate phosphatase